MTSRLRQMTLVAKFKLLSLLILLAGMLIIAGWVGRQIEEGVTERTAFLTALYVDSFISPLLQPLATGQTLDAERINELDRLLSDTPLGQEIVSFKIWLPDGTIIYSTNPALTGQTFALGESLSRALQGEVTAEMTNLQEAEQSFERAEYEQLIEIYAPVRAQGSGQIIASSEFYQLPGALLSNIQRAQWQSGLIVALCTMAMYLALLGIINRVNLIIQGQQEELEKRVAQNVRLRDRVRQAGGRTTTLNERFLRRISADIHDGPAQDLALALLRSAAVTDNHERFLPDGPEKNRALDDWQMIQVALETSLAELRAISAGLRLPEIEKLSGSDIARRALRDYERKTGCRVQATIEELPLDLPLPVKMTLYRLLQEALSNGYRHAGGVGQAVKVQVEGDELRVEISDQGPGFDPQAIYKEGHLGLATMHERAEVLGGCFNIESAPGQGTKIWSYLPLQIPQIPLPLPTMEMTHE